ncbi:hypothetical protein CHE218_13960 [Microbacterium sp. che218]
MYVLTRSTPPRPRRHPRSAAPAKRRVSPSVAPDPPPPKTHPFAEIAPVSRPSDASSAIECVFAPAPAARAPAPAAPAAPDTRKGPDAMASGPEERSVRALR